MCDFSRVSAWFCDEKISLKKSCFYLYIRRRHVTGRHKTTIIDVEDIETLGDIITNYDQIVAVMGHGMKSNNAKFNEELCSKPALF